MELITLGFIVLIIIVFVLIAETLYYLAGTDNKALFTLLFAIGFAGASINNVWQIVSSSNIVVVFFSALLLFALIFWGSTLYEQAGNKQRRWYYLTLFVPLLAVVYQIVDND